MIISHKHKFIFFKTEKTAGTSLEIALSGICGPTDVITPISKIDEQYRQELGFRGPQNYLEPKKSSFFKKLFKGTDSNLKPLFYNHISAAEVKPRLSTEQWNSYHKFAFERNPYDKIISWFYWTKADEQYGSLQKFIESGEAALLKGWNVYTQNNKLIVDKVYKYEELTTALTDLSQELNLASELKLPAKKTKSHTRKNHRHYSQVLTGQQRQWVEKEFAPVLKKFNYVFEDKTLSQ